MKPIFSLLCAALWAAITTAQTPPKSNQNPSPTVEHTRTHERLKEERPPGKRIALTIGNLFVPDKLPENAPLFIHFHGATWLAEVAAAKHKSAVIHVQLGNGSSVYARPFAEPRAFSDMLKDAEAKAARKFDFVGLTAWSAGYGAVRAILKDDKHYERVRFVLLLDGLHAGYVGGKPGPKESELVTDDLAVFVKLARDAVAGKKQFVLTHTEIFPGIFASTTETADYLLKQLELKRKPVLRWGPLGTQILCEVIKERFHLLGFAGNSAPDHVDLLHALPELLNEIDWKAKR